MSGDVVVVLGCVDDKGWSLIFREIYREMDEGFLSGNMFDFMEVVDWFDSYLLIGGGRGVDICMCDICSLI